LSILCWCSKRIPFTDARFLSVGVDWLSTRHAHESGTRRTMTQQSDRQHISVGAVVERALIVAAVIGIVAVVIVGLI